MADINDVCDYVIVKLCEGGVPLNLLKLQTIHLAPHVDAPDAQKIADWLRRCLPVSALG